MRSAQQGCEHLLTYCARLKASERLLIISDDKTKEIGNLMAEIGLKLTDQVEHCMIGALNMHGQEPAHEIAEKMIQSDVICGLTSKSMAHTQARFKATNKGARYLSLPDYSWDVLTDEALFVKFEEITPLCDHLTGLLTKGKTVTIKTPQGTHLTCHIEGRIGNSAPGWCRASGSLASPPDAECNIALIEEASHGVLVVDGSIPYDGLGLMTMPIHMKVEQGKIVSIQASNTDADRILESLLFQGEQHEQKRILAELGIGLNPKAQLKGNMLIDEGALGTFHIGVGSNATIGGKNKVNFHLDLVMRQPTIVIDDQMVLDSGEVICDFKSKN